MNKIKIDGDVSYEMAYKNKYTGVTINSYGEYSKEQMSELCKAYYERDLYLVSGKELKRLEEEKEKLINYLENKINKMNIENETEYGHARDVGMYFAYQDILEKIRSGKYE